MYNACVLWQALKKMKIVVKYQIKLSTLLRGSGWFLFSDIREHKAVAVSISIFDYFFSNRNSESR